MLNWTILEFIFLTFQYLYKNLIENERIRKIRA